MSQQRRVRNATFLSGAGAVLVGILLVGCSTTPPSNGGTPTETAAPQPTATSEPITLRDDYTCESLLPAAVLAVWQAQDGFELQPDFAERMGNLGSSLTRFTDLGGLLCQWATLAHPTL